MPRKLVASTYITLDGFIDEPGQWSFPFWCDEAAQFKSRELFAADALVLGRVTYEGFAAAWPTMEGTGEFGERMNSMPKYVASRTLAAATWNATIMRDDVAGVVRRLKQEVSGDLLIGGSGQLIDFLAEHDLIKPADGSSRKPRFLLVSAVDRFGMAETLPELGAETRYGDLIFALGIPIVLRIPGR